MIFAVFVVFLGITGIINPVNSQSADVVGGLIIYRIQDGAVQYLLQKKTTGNAWNLPKGRQTNPDESVKDLTIRKVAEETGLTFQTDYEAFFQNEIYFEYETKHGVQKKVHLFPAKINNSAVEKPIKLAADQSEYAWTEYDEALGRIKSQFKDALVKANDFIRTQEHL